MILLCALIILLTAFTSRQQSQNILSYTANPQKVNLQLYWKDNGGKPFKSIQNLKDWLSDKNEKLVFAMNGGMYMEDNSPLGLYIENFVTKTKLNALNGKGNFYLKPNGVFYISGDNKAGICITEDFKKLENVKYATQSGPMLIVDGQISKHFTKGSTNLNIRNGVGILSDNTVVFAMSKTEINFYDFASYFKDLGCKQALYLDGFVSRTYLPEKNWTQVDGNFGVILAVTEKQ
jgi:uncharacterized protein YigE (DUF2233 family)